MADTVDLTKLTPIIPPAPTAEELATLDQDTINEALAAPGSVVRALGLLTFQEINKLRVLASQPAYTMAQFKSAMKALMR